MGGLGVASRSWVTAPLRVTRLGGSQTREGASRTAVASASFKALMSPLPGGGVEGNPGYEAVEVVEPSAGVAIAPDLLGERAGRQCVLAEGVDGERGGAGGQRMIHRAEGEVGPRQPVVRLQVVRIEGDGPAVGRRRLFPHARLR